MFAADSAGAAAEIALALVEAYAGSVELPDVRVGLAYGPTLSWEGDLFGPVVNLASRLVGIANPGTVLVADELGGMLEADPAFVLRHLRPVPLKGIGHVRPWVLRRPGGGPPGQLRR
jgi:adenylate cyclase